VKPGAVLIVVLNELRIDADGLAVRSAVWRAWSNCIPAGKNRETRGDGPVKEIGLVNPKRKLRERSPNCAERSEFRQDQEIVGLIGEADEAAAKPLTGPCRRSTVCPFLELEVDVDRAFFRVALDLRGLVGFDLVEVVELIEAQELSSQRRLLNSWPSSIISSRRITLSRVVVFPLKSMRLTKYCFCSVELQRQVDDFLFFVDFRVRLGSEIDESVFAVDLAVGLQGLANFFSGEDVALFEGESAFSASTLRDRALSGSALTIFRYPCDSARLPRWGW